MLAPRQTLWSTPMACCACVAEEFSHMLLRPQRTSPEDGSTLIADTCMSAVVVDVGFGDGRMLSTLARVDAVRRVVGVDINPERVQEARANLFEAGVNAELFLEEEAMRAKVEMVVGNALEEQGLLTEADAVFMYLVPRGLRKIMPLLRDAVGAEERRGREMLVATYMNPLPGGLRPEVVRKITPPEQPLAKWPVFFYRLSADTLQQQQQQQEQEQEQEQEGRRKEEEERQQQEERGEPGESKDNGGGDAVAASQTEEDDKKETLEEQSAKARADVTECNTDNL